MIDAGKRGQILNIDPADMLIKVTPSDTVDILASGKPVRGLLVGTAGAADVIDASGATVAAVPLQAGYNWIRVSRIKATNLTASNIFALM